MNNTPENTKKPDSEATSGRVQRLVSLISWARSGESTGGERTREALNEMADALERMINHQKIAQDNYDSAVKAYDETGGFMEHQEVSYRKGIRDAFRSPFIS